MKFTAEKGVFSFEFEEDDAKRILTIDIPQRKFYQNGKAMPTFNVFYKNKALGNAQKKLEYDIFRALNPYETKVKNYTDMHNNHPMLEDKLIAYHFVTHDIERGKKPELWSLLDTREKLIRSGLYRINPKSLVKHNLSVNKKMIKKYAKYTEDKGLNNNGYRWGLVSSDNWQDIERYVNILDYQEKFPTLEWSFQIARYNHNGCNMSLKELTKREILCKKALKGLSDIVIKKFDLFTAFYDLVCWEDQTGIKINYNTNNPIKTYQKAMLEYNSIIDIETDKKIAKNLIPELEWKKDNYIFFQPKTGLELREEADQQHNCLKSYLDSYSRGETPIVFLRDKNNIKKSLVTLQLDQDNTGWQIVQKKRRFNEDVEKESAEYKIIQEYINYLNDIEKEE